MAIKSLGGKQAKPKQPVATTSKPESTLTKISHLAASLPPSAPSSASLNPSADLIDLYTHLQLVLPESTSPKELERNRQEVHTALHTLKAVFESLINAGRLHGVFKGAKRNKVEGEIDSKAQSKEEAIVEKVKNWLKERWQEYLAQTAKVAGAHWDTTVRVSSHRRPSLTIEKAHRFTFRFSFRLSTLSCRSFAPNHSSSLPYTIRNKLNSLAHRSNTL